MAVIQIDDRRDAVRAGYAQAIDGATGVFFGGGDQSRIASRIVDTPVLDAVRALKARGGVVGGTSAGTACQSAVMLTGDGDEGRVRAGNIAVTRGIGLFEGVIVDSHFVARRRYVRLQAAVLITPRSLGVGVDEATAAWVKPDGTFEVVGRGRWSSTRPGGDAGARAGGRRRGRPSAGLAAGMKTNRLTQGGPVRPPRARADRARERRAVRHVSAGARASPRRRVAGRAAGERRHGPRDRRR